MGTPHYMAPEQLEGTQAGAAADMWSLGATMYAPSRAPFAFDGADADRHHHGDPRPGTPRRPSTPGPLAGVLSKLLAKGPGAAPRGRRDGPGAAFHRGQRPALRG